MNWKNGIDHLSAQGVSIKDIAEKTGLAVSSVYDLRNGFSVEPRGMAAVRMHKMFIAHGFDCEAIQIKPSPAPEKAAATVSPAPTLEQKEAA